MVLAIAALLFQLAPATQALPDVALKPLTPAAKAAPATPAPAESATSRTAAARGASSAPSSSSYAETAFDGSSENSRALSTVRVPELQPAKPVEIIRVLEMPSRRNWLILSAAQHSAATFDAYSTRRAIGTGATEGDPLMRPFAHSPGIYAAIQVGPVLLDYVGRRMQRSQNNFLRHTWWVPQSLSTGVFLFSGIHNMNVASQH
ncbi:MAG TPA: hypothetical protein VN822_05885 [Candidatus Acidoferrales bacterium]|nr:hypothetical protein [Candidatus Acidoferrales bacterium]